MEEYSVADNQVKENYVFEVQTAVTFCHRPTPQPSSQLNFKFSCDGYSFDSISDQDSTDINLLNVAELPSMETTFAVNLREILFYVVEAQEIIREELKHWPIPGEARERLIRFALKNAQEAVVLMPTSHDHVYLHIHARALLEHVYEGRGDWIDWVAQHSMDVDEDDQDEDEDEDGMVPADNSSMEALEREKIVILTDCGSCTICMEELLEGSEGVRMPCEHVFHEDCIKKWLSFSHYCPLCRFKMPMRSENISGIPDVTPSIT